MFVKFDVEFEGFDAPAWVPYAETVERLLIAHEGRSHLVVLSPKQIGAIANGIQLSQMTRKVLGVLQKRASDYYQAMNYAERILVVCDPATTAATTIAGREIRMPANQIGRQWMHNRPHLYVEHGVNDANFYEVLAKGYLSQLAEPHEYFFINPVHGGGSTLATVVGSHDDHVLKGVCICDRDTRDPSPPFGGTSRAVHDMLVARGAMDRNHIGWCERRPMFAWSVVGAKSVENLVGPQLMEAYFDIVHSARPYRRDVVAAFPSFPILSDDEMRLWLLSNSKEGESDEAFVSAAFQRLTGRSPPWTAAKLRQMAAIHVPSGLIEWAGRMGRASAIERQIRAAIHRDLRNGLYRSAVEPIPSLIRDLLAADPALIHS